MYLVKLNELSSEFYEEEIDFWEILVDSYGLGGMSKNVYSQFLD